MCHLNVLTDLVLDKQFHNCYLRLLVIFTRDLGKFNIVA